MARLIWTESAITDLDVIADYISLDNPVAAKKLVRKVYEKVSLLETFPEMCSFPHDLPTKRYRHFSIPPIRVFYRVEGETVYIVYVMRSERLLRYEDLDR